MPCPKDSSRTDSTGLAFAGSQRQIQTYVNERTNALDSAIVKSLPQCNLAENDIHWVSPLAADTYSEYRDSEFLERVGLGPLAPRLLEFWPQNGPCWDALARIKDGCLLIEAKSHVQEIYSDGCGATSPNSKQKIQAAFAATKAWLGVAPNVDWMGRLYQSANRYASLYFLRQIAGVQAYLVNAYFVGDPRTPTTREEWDAAISSVNRELGLVREVPYSAAVYLPALATVTYHVRINSEDWTEYAAPVNSSKFVADNIFAGNSAKVVFKNASDIKQVREDFEFRIGGWLKQLGHIDGFWHEPTDVGADYRLIE